MRDEPIIIIDDDIEDLELFKSIAAEEGLPNPILPFNDPVSALDFLTNSIILPLIIICDINMPKLDGFQLRTELLNSNASTKDVPFLFLSTSKPDKRIEQANELKVHAYYTKQATYQGMKETFQSIINSVKIN